MTGEGSGSTVQSGRMALIILWLNLIHVMEIEMNKYRLCVGKMMTQQPRLNETGKITYTQLHVCFSVVVQWDQVLSSVL